MVAIQHPDVLRAPVRRAPLRLAPSATPPGQAQSVYRRRRLAALTLVVVVVVLCAVALTTNMVTTAAGANARPTPVTSATHVVRLGDTYWSIAVGLHESGDVRSAVDRLVAANGGRALQPGDRIALRASDEGGRSNE